MKSARTLLPGLRAAATWIPLMAVLGGWAWAQATAAGDVFPRRAGENLWSFARDMLAVLPAMFMLIGLFDVWVPRAVIERHVGRDSGAKAVGWMILLAMLQAGPLYVAFPVAVALWRKGCAPRNVFIYLGAFSSIKLPLLSFEVACLGWTFSLVRTAITLPVFIALAYLLEKQLPRSIQLPEQEPKT